jgi:hypothetical protein
MMKVSIINPESIMVIDKPGGKPSANSKRYAFSLKMAIGGMTFPTGFVQASVLISYYFPQKFWSTRLYVESQRTLLRFILELSQSNQHFM